MATNKKERKLMSTNTNIKLDNERVKEQFVIENNNESHESISLFEKALREVSNKLGLYLVVNFK
jgi:hypothetical protein